jgi:hypothetical protein
LTKSEELVEFFEIKNSLEADKEISEESKEQATEKEESPDGELDIF